MKKFNHLKCTAIILCFFINACSTGGGNIDRAAPLKCERQLQIVGHNVTFKGISIPSGKVTYTLGEFAYTQTTLQKASNLLMQYDFSQKTVCELARTHPAGSERRRELEDKMVSFATGALEAAKILSGASNQDQAATAVKTVEADLTAKSIK